MRGKILFWNRFTDLSVEIYHIDSHISFDKNWFSRFKSENLDSTTVLVYIDYQTIDLGKLSDYRMSS